MLIIFAMSSYIPYIYWDRYRKPCEWDDSSNEPIICCPAEPACPPQYCVSLLYIYNFIYFIYLWFNNIFNNMFFLCVSPLFFLLFLIFPCLFYLFLYICLFLFSFFFSFSFLLTLKCINYNVINHKIWILNHSW